MYFVFPKLISAHGWTLMPTGISNYFHYKVWDEITYLFPNFNAAHPTIYSSCCYQSWAVILKGVQELSRWRLMGRRREMIRLLLTSRNEKTPHGRAVVRNRRFTEDLFDVWILCRVWWSFYQTCTQTSLVVYCGLFYSHGLSLIPACKSNYKI